MTISNRTWGDRDSGGYVSWEESDERDDPRRSLDDIISNLIKLKDGLSAGQNESYETTEYVTTSDWEPMNHGNNDSKQYLVERTEAVTTTHTRFVPDENTRYETKKKIEKILKENKDVSVKFFVDSYLIFKEHTLEDYKSIISDLEQAAIKGGLFSREREDYEMMFYVCENYRPTLHAEYLENKGINNLKISEIKFLYNNLKFEDPLKLDLAKKLNYGKIRLWLDKRKERKNGSY